MRSAKGNTTTALRRCTLFEESAHLFVFFSCFCFCSPSFLLLILSSFVRTPSSTTVTWISCCHGCVT